MTHTQNWQQVLISIRKIIRATDLHSKRLIKECGLTIPQLVILRAIDELEDITAGSLSDHVSLSQATVTNILSRLEERGLINRSRLESDKRVVRTRLTESGKAVLDNAPDLLHEQFIERFTLLADWEQSQILSSLQRVAHMMDASKIDAAPILTTMLETPSDQNAMENEFQLPDN